jgi:iron-sulfur cluster insertion protein
MNDMPEVINLTDSAISKVKTLIEEEQNYNLKLRIFVQGGGCSGFQYGFAFEEVVEEDDFHVEKESEGVKISFLIDSMSLQYLQGATIDFVSNLEGEQFVIKNPNATTTCGCGSSFSA